MSTALYIHVPLCLRKCAYCDFVSIEAVEANVRTDAETRSVCTTLGETGSELPEQLSIADALKSQLVHLAPQTFSDKQPVYSVYFGGGTPTALGHRLLDLVDTALALPGAQDVEVTVETNPETTDQKLIEELIERGVNRFSLGVQSFHDNELNALGRIHTVEKAQEALGILTSVGEVVGGTDVRVSLDLMAGIPEQTMESWRASLNEAIASGVGHISVYPLTAEEGTPLAALVEAGLELPDDDTVADMLEEAGRILGKAGFRRYETSNYAKPGQESRHNLAYWSGVPYLGIGPSAASMFNLETGEDLPESIATMMSAQAALTKGEATPVEDDPIGRIRLSWTDDVCKYVRDPLSRPTSCETLTVAQRAAEDLMLGLRRSEGVSLEEEEKWVGESPPLRDAVSELLANDLLEIANGNIRIPDDKWLIGNEIFGRVWSIE